MTILGKSGGREGAIPHGAATGEIKMSKIADSILFHSSFCKVFFFLRLRSFLKVRQRLDYAVEMISDHKTFWDLCANLFLDCLYGRENFLLAYAQTLLCDAHQYRVANRLKNEIVIFWSFIEIYETKLLIWLSLFSRVLKKV